MIAVSEVSEDLLVATLLSQRDEGVWLHPRNSPACGTTQIALMVRPLSDRTRLREVTDARHESQPEEVDELLVPTSSATRAE